MPIREETFRIGCGRYLQKAGLLKNVGEEVLRFGNIPFIIGGKTALEITRFKLEESITKYCKKYVIKEYLGTCNDEKAQEFASFAVKNGFDVIVGVGGGVMMDFAKLIAFYANLPVINIPTQTATCAAYTPLSVCYTPDGKTVGTKHFQKEVSAVIVDTELLSKQPIRLLLAGVFDALAKFVEIKQRFNPKEEYPLGLDWAFLMAEHSFKELCELTPIYLEDLKQGKITEKAERLFFILIAVTGVISGIARGSNQTALAHKFYEGTRSMYFSESKNYLHGEIVGVGLLLQNHFNNEVENNEFLLSLMKAYNMPCSITDIGLNRSEEVKKTYFDKLKSGSAIDQSNPNELTKLEAGLDYLWGI